MNNSEMMVDGTCSWGLGSFKETNKRYVLLVINWGGRECYAFKVMRNGDEVQMVQGGHMYLNIEQSENNRTPIFFEFISNSVLCSFHSSEKGSSALFVVTSQFEYGLPFTIKQIDNNAKQEQHIQKISNGQYLPRFKIFSR